MLPSVRVCEAEEFVGHLDKDTQIYAVRVRQAAAVAEVSTKIPEELRDFADVFEYKDVATLNRPQGVEHAINLELGKRPPFRLLYNLSPKELEVLREYLEMAQQNR